MPKRNHGFPLSCSGVDLGVRGVLGESEGTRLKRAQDTFVSAIILVKRYQGTFCQPSSRSTIPQKGYLSTRLTTECKVSCVRLTPGAFPDSVFAPRQFNPSVPFHISRYLVTQGTKVCWYLSTQITTECNCVFFSDGGYAPRMKSTLCSRP